MRRDCIDLFSLSGEKIVLVGDRHGSFELITNLPNEAKSGEKDELKRRMVVRKHARKADVKNS